MSPRVLVYSDSADVRAAVVLALGSRPAPELGRIEVVEAATNEDVLAAVDAGGIDVVVFDGEARPTGGFGIAKQLKDELTDCPHTVVLTARPGDAWLASWALADGVLGLPVDPPAVRETVAQLLRDREAALPVRRAAAR